jgi:hypothetical protein
MSRLSRSPARTRCVANVPTLAPASQPQVSDQEPATLRALMPLLCCAVLCCRAVASWAACSHLQQHQLEPQETGGHHTGLVALCRTEREEEKGTDLVTIWWIHRLTCGMQAEPWLGKVGSCANSTVCSYQIPQQRPGAWVVHASPASLQ